MKRRVRPYVKYALREHVLYIVMFILLIIFTIGFVFFAPGIYSQNNEKIAQLETDIRDLGQKKAVLDSSLGGNLADIDLDVEVMRRLIPEGEDYFSAIAALEELSGKTGFLITSYVVNLADSDGSKLSLSISGVGDEQSFINFLQEYNFGGGRLITIENVALGREEASSFNLILNFYNQKSDEASNENLNYQYALQKVEELKSKITFSLEPQPSQQLTGDYEKESNPF